MFKIVQNLQSVNFEEDSDEDTEWNPNNEENEEDDEENEIEKDRIHCCTSCDYQTKHLHMFKRHMLTKHKTVGHTKRKIELEIVVPSKKKKVSENQNDNLICDVCESKFTRKDNLKRHKLKKH